MHRVLLVDDNPDVVDYMAEVLGHSLQLPFDTATNVEDAHRLLEAHDYGCILLDLEIPATAKGERSRPENGVALFKQAVKIKGAGIVAIVLMTSHTNQALAYMSDLQNDGLVFGMPKDLWNKGRAPEVAIREALSALEARRREADTAANGLQPFTGGPMVIYADGATLCERVILNDSSLSPMRDVLLLLNQKDGQGFRRIRRGTLAKKLDTTAESLNGVFYRFRRKVARVLKDECKLAVGDYDVLGTDNGDFLAEGITVDLRLGETIESAMFGHGNGHDGAEHGHENGHDPERALDHLGVKQKGRLMAIAAAMKKGPMTREQVEALAGVGRSQVTRDLEELEGAGLVRRTGSGKGRRYAYAGSVAAPNV